jgi:hypothetical protein
MSDSVSLPRSAERERFLFVPGTAERVGASLGEPNRSRLMSLADENIVVVDWALLNTRELGGVMYPSVTPSRW